MNPPYCRNLHLKILNEAIHHSDDIVNLSPNFYENYKKLKNVTKVTNRKENEFDVKDTFECDEKMVDYLTGNNALKKVVVKVIEVKPEKVTEEEVKEKPKKKKSSKK